MSVADDRVADLANEFDDGTARTPGHVWRPSSAYRRMSPTLERLLHATGPIMLLVLKLGVGDRPGAALKRTLIGRSQLRLPAVKCSLTGMQALMMDLQPQYRFDRSDLLAPGRLARTRLVGCRRRSCQTNR